jgi:hypothetical protein
MRESTSKTIYVSFDAISIIETVSLKEAPTKIILSASGSPGACQKVLGKKGIH